MLSDRKLDEQLATSGYVVIQLLEPDELAVVRAAVAAAGPAPGDTRTGLFNDTWSTDHGYRVAAADALRVPLDPVASAAFSGYHSLTWVTITKWPGADGAVVAHRDLSFVEETRHQSYGVWCALEDVGPAEGTLYVVPRSHREAPPIRVHQSADNIDPGFDPTTDARAVTISLSAGQALVYHHGLIHGSGPNETERRRTVVAGVLVPDDVSARYSIELEPGRGVSVEIDSDFFVDVRLDHLDIEEAVARCHHVEAIERGPDGHWIAAST